MLPADQINATGPPAILPYAVPKNRSSAATAIHPLHLALALPWIAVGAITLL